MANDRNFHWTIAEAAPTQSDVWSRQVTALQFLPGLKYYLTASASCFRNGLRVLILVDGASGVAPATYEWYTDENTSGADDQMVDVPVRLDGDPVHVAKGYPEIEGRKLYVNHMGLMFYRDDLELRERSKIRRQAHTGVGVYDSLLNAAASIDAADAIDSMAGPMRKLLTARSARIELPLQGFKPRPVVDLNPQDKVLHQYLVDCNARLGGRTAGTTPSPTPAPLPPAQAGVGTPPPQAPAPVPAGVKSIDQYQPSWIGHTMVVRGTVSRFVQRKVNGESYVYLYFKERPDSTVVACSRDDSWLLGVLGVGNFNAVVGKTIEFNGEVVKGTCTEQGAGLWIWQRNNARLVGGSTP